MRHEVFGGQGFYVEPVGDRVIMTESSPVWGGRGQVIFMRPVEFSPLGAPGIWSIIGFTPWSPSSGFSLQTITAMSEFLDSEFGANFKPYKGDLAFLNNLCGQKRPSTENSDDATSR
jgi:hypothetical protein